MVRVLKGQCDNVLFIMLCCTEATQCLIVITNLFSLMFIYFKLLQIASQLVTVGNRMISQPAKLKP